MDITMGVPMFYRVRSAAALNVTGPGGVAFASIPAGTYPMGGNLDGQSDAPVTSVPLSEYWLQTTETTKAQWDLVRTWGLTNGYANLSVGGGKATNHPVQTITWYDMVKWCNAASEREGLVPCYYTDTNQMVVYRTGNTNIDNTKVKWGANGYRLPTEAEWEVAARGGLSGKLFPWGDTIRNGPASSGGQANYYGDTGYFSYDLGPNGYNSAFNDGVAPYTSPVGSFSANGYGLYDMAGNVGELCWDWYGTYNGGTNPQGPVGGAHRVMRGGGWSILAIAARCAQRSYELPGNSYAYFGFRLARGRP
jgi:formylglycine-generating enzyme required for sulfatase activity